MRVINLTILILLSVSVSLPGLAVAQATDDEPVVGDSPSSQESEVVGQGAEPEDSNDNDPDDTSETESTADSEENASPADSAADYGPVLPDGMSLDDVLDIAAKPPPKDFPQAVPDDRIYAFVLGERLEYRAENTNGEGHAGLELQAWAGGDFNKIWFKAEADGSFVEDAEVDVENDLLYSRLLTPFWNLQAGAQYALGWADNTYEDRWSAVFALQGMAPGMFEVDASVYLSESLDLTGVLSAEYDVRVTQRLVFQPSAEFGFSAQSIEKRGLGTGLTDMNLDARLRYEFARKFAPYLGTRYRLRTFGSAEFAREAGESPGSFFLIAGLRFAI